MADPLQKLFGSPARVKLLRLFLFNPRLTFSISDAAAHAQVQGALARKEVALLQKAGVIKRTGSRTGTARFTIRDDFEYLAALQNLLLNAPARGEDITARIRGVGAIKLIVVSGIFIGEWEGRLDLLIAGDRVKERLLYSRMRSLESELGKELRYALLPTQDFLYRYNMNDKLTRDVFDYPHKVVLDRLNIGLK